MTTHPDPMDRATELEELERQSAMNLHRAQAARDRLRPVGTCHNCQDQLKTNALFCDQSCRDDWERRRAAKLRNGQTA